MGLNRNWLSDYNRIIVAALWLGCNVILFFTVQSMALFLKGSLFALSLACIGVCDAKTHTIPNRYLWPVMLIGLIDFKPIPAITGFFIVSVIFYIAAKFTQDGIGGGDIKFIAAAGFVLGAQAIIYAALLGISLFLFVSSLFFRGQRKKKYYAMAPWLGIGCFLAFIIFY